MASFREAFLGKRSVCWALTIVYSIYNTVGQSITSIYDLGCIFTSALRASVNMSPWVVYIGYGPPYRTIYITYQIIFIYISTDIYKYRLIYNKYHLIYNKYRWIYIYQCIFIYIVKMKGSNFLHFLHKRHPIQYMSFFTFAAFSPWSQMLCLLWAWDTYNIAQTASACII